MYGTNDERDHLLFLLPKTETKSKINNLEKLIN